MSQAGPLTGALPSVTEMLRALQALNDALDRMHSGIKGEMEINATDLAALRMLIVREQRGQPVSPNDVARHLRISTASTTKLLDRLSLSGHLERRPHPYDGRARIVVLTDLSRREFFRHFGAHLQQMRDVAERYTEQELAVISRFMLELADTLDPH